MSGNFTPFSPINGQLPNAQATILTCPDGLNYYLKKWFLLNESGSAQTIQCWILPNGGTAQPINRLKLDANESADLLEDGESITLTPGDSIQSTTTDPASVDYTFTGVQES